MPRLFPTLRPILKRSSGVQDQHTVTALRSLEAWADEVTNLVASITDDTLGSVLLPIALTDVTGLVAALAARPTGSGTANTVVKFTSASVVGDSTITDTGSLVTVSNPSR